MDCLTLFGLLVFGWFATFTGVLLGGYLVYRATGKSGPLFNQPGGDAYNLPDEFTDGTGEEVEPPDELKKMNERFQQTFKGGGEEYDPGQDLFGYGNQAAARAWTPPDIQEDEDGDIVDDNTEPLEDEGEDNGRG